MSSDFGVVHSAGHYLSQVQNRQIQGIQIVWIGFDKYNKFVYGAIMNPLFRNMEIVVQSIYGGNSIPKKNIPLENNDVRVTAAIGGEMIALCILNVQNYVNSFYLLSVTSGTVQKYKIASTSFGGRKIPIRKVDYSSKVGFFSVSYVPPYSVMNFGEIYCFTFDDHTKTFEAEFITKCPNSSLYRNNFIAFDKYFFIFTETCHTVDIFDAQNKFWSTKELHNAPTGKSHTSVTANEDGKYIALFYKEMNQSQRLYNYVLHELVQDYWEERYIAYCSSIWSRINMFYSTDDILLVYNYGKSNEPVFINLRILSLQEIAFKTIVRCWNSNISFESFLDALNLPTLMKRYYVGPSWMKNKNTCE